MDHPQININEACRFLDCFEGNHTFQTFSDKGDKGIIPRNIGLTLEDLITENLKGSGSYVTINEGNGKGRSSHNIIRIRAFFADLDNTPLPTRWILPPSIIVETSPGRFHAYWLTSDKTPLSLFKGVQKAIAELYGGDSSVCDLCRVMRIPGFIHWKGKPFLSRIVFIDPSIRYTTEEILAAYPPKNTKTFQAGNNAKSSEKNHSAPVVSALTILKTRLSRTNPCKDGRNNTGLAIALQMRDNGISQQECERILLTHYQAKYENQGNHPYTAEECRKTIAQVYSRPSRDSWQRKESIENYSPDPSQKEPISNDNSNPPPQKKAPQPPSNNAVVQEGPPKFGMSDSANALRLVHYFGDKLRYNPELGTWFVWNGKYWQDDIKREVYEYAKEIASLIFKEVAECPDREKCKQLVKHALASESKPKIDNMIALARSDPAIVLTTQEFDTDPYLLNMANGTFNLRTMQLQPHNPNDHITLYSPVIHNSKTTHPIVNKLIELLKKDNRAEFLQRSIGSCLIGEAPSEALWILIGEGGTGKSTFIEAIETMLGSYAVSADVSLLIGDSAKTPGNARPDLIDLIKARLVITKELPANSSFNTSEIKAMTGNDTICARA